MIITKLVVVIIKECVEKAQVKKCKRRRKSYTRFVLTLNNVLIGSKRFIMSDNDDEG